MRNVNKRATVIIFLKLRVFGCLRYHDHRIFIMLFALYVSFALNANKIRSNEGS